MFTWASVHILQVCYLLERLCKLLRVILHVLLIDIPSSAPEIQVLPSYSDVSNCSTLYNSLQCVQLHANCIKVEYKG